MSVYGIFVPFYIISLSEIILSDSFHLQMISTYKIFD